MSKRIYTEAEVNADLDKFFDGREIASLTRHIFVELGKHGLLDAFVEVVGGMPDDDGFTDQIQIAMIKAHASADDLKILIMKSFVIRFESGVLVVRHWRMHNTLRKDRYVPTLFQEELAQLGVTESQSYALNDDGCHLVAKRLP